MKEHNYRFVGSVALAVICTPSQLFGQSPIALKPIPQQTQGTSSEMVPLPPPPSYSPNKPITLESIPKAENSFPLQAAPEAKPLSVKPIALEAQDSKVAKKPRLNADEMVNRPVTSVDVLSRLNMMKGLDAGASLAPDIRNQSPESSNFYDWSPAGFYWESPAFCHSPLYFEQPNLERYGNGKGHLLTPAWSATYFFGQAVAWPITSVCQPPWTKQCTLGNHRPGDCAPFQRRQYRHHTLASAAQPKPFVFSNETQPTEEIVSLAIRDNVTIYESDAPAGGFPSLAESNSPSNEPIAPPVVVSTTWKPLVPPVEVNEPSSKPFASAESNNTPVVRQISFR